MKAEADLCEFKCTSINCTVKDTLIRDQILIGTNNEAIHEDALKINGL